MFKLLHLAEICTHEGLIVYDEFVDETSFTVIWLFGYCYLILMIPVVQYIFRVQAGLHYCCKCVTPNTRVVVGIRKLDCCNR